MLRFPAARLARQVAFYDSVVGEGGLGAGGEWATERLCRGLSIRGAERIPEEGPVLVVSNHPGLADSLSLFVALARSGRGEDLRVVVEEREFLRALPNTSRYLIPARDPGGRPAGVGSLRAASRHLGAGGALLVFPRGRIEPDPASMPGAEDSLGDWGPSLDLFARLAPEAPVIPAIVSGVISPAALSSPITRLRRRPEDSRWLAASLQMLVPALRNVHTRVSFGHPVYRGDDKSVAGAREEILSQARRMILSAGAPR